MKKILILGVNGFIGHHLSQRILDTTDWAVYGMDMNADRVADLMDNPRFHFFEGDIMINKEWIEYHVKKCDVILPLVDIGMTRDEVAEKIPQLDCSRRSRYPVLGASWQPRAGIAHHDAVARGFARAALRLRCSILLWSKFMVA